MSSHIEAKSGCFSLAGGELPIATVVKLQLSPARGESNDEQSAGLVCHLLSCYGLECHQWHTHLFYEGVCFTYGQNRVYLGYSNEGVSPSQEGADPAILMRARLPRKRGPTQPYKPACVEHM